MAEADVLIVGAGIGGASLGYALLQAQPTLSVTILEAESQPGYHTTGRSAAFYAQTYGGPRVQPLTTASHDFLARPPAEFSRRGFLLPRGALYLCNRRDAVSVKAFDELAAQFVAEGLRHSRLDSAELRRRAPLLRADWTGRAIFDPDCSDIDVGGLHQAFLAAVKRAGGRTICDARVTALARLGGRWQATTAAGDQFRAARVVNAAGAWADEVALAAGVGGIGIAPLRRTMVVADTSPPPPADLPILMDAGGSIYAKPDAGQLWISPHDETPDVPRDVQPEELDIAITMDRFEHLCDWPVRRISRTWAGLRNFAPDRLPVLGPDPAADGFFWCAGQGGWGIQTSAAAAAVGAAVLLGVAAPPPYAAIDAGRYSPARFR